MNSNNEKISVIVPIYKVEKYLCRCIESIIGQTYDNLEIILVDDGSPDKCPEICDKYAALDSRIVVLHTPNGGVSAARNQALAVSDGQYLTFVDGDDFVAPDYIKCLYHLLTVTGADISICGSQNIREDVPENNVSFAEYTAKDTGGITLFSPEEALCSLLYQVPFDAAPWGKLFKRKFFESIRFPIGCWYEDFAVMPQIFARAKCIAYCPYAGYGYVQRQAGTTLKSFSPEKMQLLDIAEANETFITEKYPELLPAAYSRVVRANLHVYSQIPLHPRYRAYRKRIIKNVCMRRKAVLSDKKTRTGTRLALLMTYAGFWNIRIFHRLKFLGKK